MKQLPMSSKNLDEIYTFPNILLKIQSLSENEVASKWKETKKNSINNLCNHIKKKKEKEKKVINFSGGFSIKCGRFVVLKNT